MNDAAPLRLGTRASPLARWQAEWVAGQLAARGINVELVPITTSGDVEQAAPLGTFGGQGVFTKELQRQLLERRIDLAVHSLKDLPTDAVPGLTLAAVPQRAPVGDVLVTRRWPSLDELPEGAVVGTGSLRRRSQLLHARPDLTMKDVRGNVDTRLRKLAAGEYHALVLAEAGMQRLGLTEHIRQRLPLSLMLPAVGQGALGIEMRDDDQLALDMLAPLNHAATRAAVLAERALLATLRGGCLAPIGAYGRIGDDSRLRLTAVVLSADGSQRLEASGEEQGEQAEALGRWVAEELLAQGADRLIADTRRAGLQPPGPQ